MGLATNLLAILRCPVCKGALSATDCELRCPACDKRYPIVLGIPDLRVYEDPLIPLQDDYRKGEKLQVQAERLGFADLVRYYWSLPTYPPTPPELRDRFIHHVLTDEYRIEAYKDKLGSGRAFLEVGCGTAALVEAVHDRFQFAVACDVAFRWLIVARRRFQEAGLPVNPICCCADYLPFAGGSFDAVASVSLLEHLPEAGSAIREFGRVLDSRGSVFIWTSNRFSLAPEPHVRVWGVGFLPRRWMPVYVNWRSRLAYEKKRLLSCFELRRLLKRAGLRSMRFSLPAITRGDWEYLRGLERFAARVFSVAAAIPVLRGLLVVLSPVLLVVARRRPAAAAQAVPAQSRSVNAAS